MTENTLDQDGFEYYHGFKYFDGDDINISLLGFRFSLVTKIGFVIYINLLINIIFMMQIKLFTAKFFHWIFQEVYYQKL